MGPRDHFYTPRTARAIPSWRLLVAVGVVLAVLLAVGGLGVGAGLAVGTVLYVTLVWAAMPRAPDRIQIDPFTVQEPWRKFVGRAQRSETRLHDSIDAADTEADGHDVEYIVAELEGQRLAVAETRSA